MTAPVLSPNNKSYSANDIPSQDGNVKFVSYGDLIRLAHHDHCHGILTEPVLTLCRPEKNFWVFKATVYKSAKCRGFVGYGDAHPGNVSPLIFNHAEMRMAETRAVNRALRKAYGVALCSAEELPPWALTPQQISQFRKDLQSPSRFKKGAYRAHKNQRPQSVHKTKPSRRRTVSRSRRQVPARGPLR
jgi:hypothetical protein